MTLADLHMCPAQGEAGGKSVALSEMRLHACGPHIIQAEGDREWLGWVWSGMYSGCHKGHTVGRPGRIRMLMAIVLHVLTEKQLNKTEPVHSLLAPIVVEKSHKWAILT